MSAETEEPEEPQRQTPHLFIVLRKIAIAGAALFVLWIFAGKNLQHGTSPHPVAGADKTAKNAAAPLSPSVHDEEISQLNERVEHLEAWTKAHENAGTSSADAEHIAQLEKDLQAMEEKFNEAQAENSHALSAHLETLSALGILKETLLRGEPFSAQIAALRKLAEDNDKATALLAQLAAFGDGVATPAALQNRFDALVPQALATNDSGNAIARNLRSLIQIRKVGEQQKGGNDEAILARAEAKIDRGDVEASVRELAALSPPAAAVFSSWISDAKRSLQARSLVDDVQLAMAGDNAKSPAPEAIKAAPAP